MLLWDRTHEESGGAQGGTSGVGRKSLGAQAAVAWPSNQNIALSGRVSLCNLSCPQWVML